MWCAVAHTRHATAGISAHRCVPCAQIILEEAAYCDPGLVSEVYAKRKAIGGIAHASRAASVLAKGRSVTFNAAVGPSLHQVSTMPATRHPKVPSSRALALCAARSWTAATVCLASNGHRNALLTRATLALRRLQQDDGGEPRHRALP